MKNEEVLDDSNPDKDETPNSIDLMGKDVRLVRLVPKYGEIATVGMLVRCNLRGYYYNMKEERRLSNIPFEASKNEVFQIGEADTFPGLELGLRHSRKGETLLIKISSRFAFGFQGRSYDESTMKGKAINELPSGVVPPNMDVEYEVEVVDHTPDAQLTSELSERFKTLTSTMTDDREIAITNNRLKTIQSLLLRKDAGNRWFHIKDFARASQAYSKATKLADTYFNKESNEKISIAQTLEEKAKAIEASHQGSVSGEDGEVVGVYITCLNNLIACKISLNEFLQAKDLCVKVLELDPMNVKALIRAAKASLALDLYDECEVCLKHLTNRPDLDDNSRVAVQSLGVKLKKAMQDYRDKTKQMQQKIAKGLFGGSDTKNNAVKVPSDNKPINSERKEEVKLEKEIPSVKRNEEKAEEKEKHAQEQPLSVSTTQDHNINSTIEQYHNSTTTKSPQLNTNMIFLILTSLAVLVISILVAYYSLSSVSTAR